MTSSTRLEFNDAAIKELLASPALQADIQRRVNNVQQAAAGMYGAKNYIGDVIMTDRPHGAVRVGDVYAARSCMKHNTLLKAMNAGKG